MATRITGLYSNLDVDALVEAGVSLYQTKLDKAEQKKQILEWKQEQYQAISSDVSDFYSDYLATGSGLMSTSTWNTKTFTSSDDSLVSATCTSDATLDDYKVSVTQLAAAATTTLSSSDYESTDTLEINGTTIDLSSISSTLSSTSKTDKEKGQAVASLINTTLGSSATVTATYSELSGGVVLTSSSLGSSASFTVQKTDDTSATTYKGQNLHATITNSEGTTTYTIDDDTNTTIKNQVTLDDITFTFSGVTSTTTSSTKYLTSSSIESLLGDNIKKIDTSVSGQTTYTLTDGSTIVLENDGDVTATNADGTTDAIEFTNSDGSKISISSGTSGAVAVTSTDDNAVTLTGTNDVSDIQDTLESFIEDYNTLITSINTRIYEDYDSDYQPLTDAEKEEMSDDEIEAWNEQAQTGLLEHDDYLEALAQDMKDAMSTFLKSAGIDIESIGIDAVEDYTTENGTYEVDSDALEEALSDEDTFSNLKKLFTNGSSNITSFSTSNSDTDGILARLKVALNVNVMSATSQFAEIAGVEDFATSLYNNQIYEELQEQDDLIDKLEDLLADKEDALYEKYSTLETNLASLSSVSSLFGSSSS